MCLLGVGLTALVYWTASKASESPSIPSWLGWLVLLVVAYPPLQLLPLPMSLVRTIAPARAQIADSLAAVTAAPNFATLSISPTSTVPLLLTVLGCTLTFLLVREVAWHCRQRQSWAPVIPLIGLGLLEALIAFSQAAAGTDVIGTYNSQNHFAGLLEMILPFALAPAAALLLSAGTAATHSSPVPRLATVIGLLAAGIAMLVAVASALSKMGFFAALSAVFVVTILALPKRRGAPRWLGATAAVAVFFLLFLALPSDQLVSGYGWLQTSGRIADAEGRWPIFQDSLGLLRAYPVFGSGLGTYATAFLPYQTALVDLAFTFAHNDYLQIVSELGVVGSLAAFALILTLFTIAIRAAVRAQNWHARVLGLGCAGAMAAIGIHSLVDFNMYIPANALTLAWIAGIAASLAPGTPGRIGERKLTARRPAIAAASVLMVYASAWIVLSTAFQGDVRAEQRFCDFGICDSAGVREIIRANHGGVIAAAPVDQLVEMLRRDPANASRWADLAEAMARAGRREHARSYFARALELGPNIPPVVLRVARFHADSDQWHEALALTSRVLASTDQFDREVYAGYPQRVGMTEFLDRGLPSARAARSYLRFIISNGTVDEGMTVWQSLSSRGQVDQPLAVEYASFLWGHQQYENAAKAWAEYLRSGPPEGGHYDGGPSKGGHYDGGPAKGGHYDDGPSKGGHDEESNVLFNGGFERAPSGAVFDWRMENLGDDVTVKVDRGERYSGAQSARIEFAGKANVSYSNLYQTAVVTPGDYVFQAYVQTKDVTTDSGVGFRVFGSEGPSTVDVHTETVRGTRGWTKLAATLRVPSGIRLLTVQAVRERSLKFDSHISGTAWIDDVVLTRETDADLTRSSPLRLP